MRWKLAVCLGMVVLLVALAGDGLRRGWWRINHPDPARYSAWGVDVSHHQGRIDWPAVAREPHLTFAYIKATEGGDWTDREFQFNWQEARRAGLRVGAYHFFTFCRSPADQARHFLSVLPGDADTLPPAVDLEFGGNCGLTKSKREVQDSLRQWLQIVETTTSRSPVIYATREAYEAFLKDGQFPNRVWIRDIWTEPRLPSATPWAFWQFANRGRVKGIAGLVDLNVFYQDRAALDRF